MSRSLSQSARIDLERDLGSVVGMARMSWMNFWAMVLYSWDVVSVLLLGLIWGSMFRFVAVRPSIDLAFLRSSSLKSDRGYTKALASSGIELPVQPMISDLAATLPLSPKILTISVTHRATSMISFRLPWCQSTLFVVPISSDIISITCLVLNESQRASNASFFALSKASCKDDIAAGEFADECLLRSIKS